MDCARARTYIECYVDGELDPVTGADIEKHLHQCPTCQRARDRLIALRALIREGVPYRVAPDRLSREIRARVNRARNDSRWRGGALWWQWGRPAALVAATALVTWLAASQLGHPSRNDLIAGEIIASHARATLTGHVADVASSERHTVKPWLSSKLDFSPPVTDLTSAGFPLVGGRLDYVDHRPVAVLVYGRRKHVIDVFVWPAGDARAVPTSEALSRQGYQVLHWSHGGMTFWAISDLNAGELNEFAGKFSSPK